MARGFAPVFPQRTPRQANHLTRALSSPSDSGIAPPILWPYRVAAVRRVGEMALHDAARVVVANR